MPKPVVTLLAVPVLAWIVALSLLRRSMLVRGLVAFGLGGAIALGALGFVRPAPIAATPTTPVVPVPQADFQTIVATGVGVNDAAVIRFSTPMDRASVEAAVQVDPPTLVEFSWASGGTELHVAPVIRWQAAAYHTVTVQQGALAASGRPMTKPARAAFVTRLPAGASLEATSMIDRRIAVDTAFRIRFERPVDPASLVSAVTLEPATAGTLAVDASEDGTPTYRFTPETDLQAGTWYRLTVAGVVDDAGVPVDAASRAFQTIEAPSVVRFRPRPYSQDIERGAAISVRFTIPMDPATTSAAFRASADGTALRGAIRFAEGDTVLVFVPAQDLPWDSRVVVTVSDSAMSADGVPLAASDTAAFRTEAKPLPPPPPPPLPAPPPANPAPSTGGGSGGSTGGSGGSTGGSGGSVGSGSWTAVERYYLDLMNCTRTGGLVTSSGSCSSPGGRNVAALKLDSGISSKVSRPYAKRLATGNLCSHFVGGNPGDRLRAAGYTSYVWAENLGCRSGEPKAAVLGSHLYFQSERSWSPLGGHYVNLMNSKYDRAGIGVWASGGRVRLVVNFYHP